MNVFDINGMIFFFLGGGGGGGGGDKWKINGIWGKWKLRIFKTLAAGVSGGGGGCLNIFTLLYLFSPLSPSLWETTQYRLKYCLKGLLNPKQPTLSEYDCQSNCSSNIACYLAFA